MSSAASSPAATALFTHEIEIRARYPECDPMGVAHHTVYPIWFEIGRTEMLRAQRRQLPRPRGGGGVPSGGAAGCAVSKPRALRRSSAAGDGAADMGTGEGRAHVPALPRGDDVGGSVDDAGVPRPRGTRPPTPHGNGARHRPVTRQEPLKAYKKCTCGCQARTWHVPGTRFPWKSRPACAEADPRLSLLVRQGWPSPLPNSPPLRAGSDKTGSRKRPAREAREVCATASKCIVAQADRIPRACGCSDSRPRRRPNSTFASSAPRISAAPTMFLHAITFRVMARMRA